ncbi:restriction endonuclease subunit S [Methanococcus maripaludis]|uniref:Type I restriction enzyme S subunit n=1 Tax=Methanococcus maripaludis TaxID=39152 RepID=A0A7J9PU27_METMI|nr:restriction endonuclease subunit S [Methanococcus maripaludis]MBA2868938.1 type I restriction enzyme S subunit [Methanococcus maripaludis]
MGGIPEGYKETKIGVIPEYWDVKSFKEVSKIVGGGTPDTENMDFWNGNIRWCTPTDISKNSAKFIEKTEKTISELGLKNSSATILPPNTVLMCSRATIGEKSISKYEITTNQGFKSFICNNSLNFEYLYYLIDILKKEFIKRANGTTFIEISKKDVEKIQMPLPPAKEQQKIAEILSTWDKSIEKLENLISKKIETKKGLMQNLLTGNVRFSEFESEWKEVKLGDILKERNDVGYLDLELLAITMKNGVIKRSELDLKDNSSENKSKYKRILPGDIGYNTMRMWQGVSGLSNYEGIVSPAYTIVTPKKDVSGEYIAYLFKTSNMINLFHRYSQGLVNDTLNLKYKNFKIINAIIPKSIEEQEKIASVLSTQDKEIELLKQKLELVNTQKKGLMQNLLTGKIRVKTS